MMPILAVPVVPEGLAAEAAGAAAGAAAAAVPLCAKAVTDRTTAKVRAMGANLCFIVAVDSLEIASGNSCKPFARQNLAAIGKEFRVRMVNIIWGLVSGVNPGHQEFESAERADDDGSRP